MKKYLLVALLLPGRPSQAQRPLPPATKSLTEAQAQAQVLADTLYLQQHYAKTSYQVPMRDGVKLYTIVYTPRDADKVRYPIMLKRTPYSIGPYAPTRYPLRISPSSAMLHEGYIFVFQDVRGKYLSEGTFVDVRPALGTHSSRRATDESTDTYDTIEFLLKKGPKSNGRVGQWGVSYPGFYTTAGLLSRHPALKAASPQAPVTDWFWDDYHHNGAYMLAASFGFLGEFGQPRPHPTAAHAPYVQLPTPDGYDFFLRLGSLQHVDADYYRGQVAFWREITQHPNYDDTWRARDPRPHLHDLKTAVLTVGGFNDAEDLFGALHTYAAIEQQNPGLANRLVMGPWVHGGWAYGTGELVGNVAYGPSPSLWYQENVEAPFFKSYLKAEKPGSDLPEAIVFEGGTNRWRTFDAWPPQPAQARTLYFRQAGGLSFSPPPAGSNERRPEDLAAAFDQFVSDPAHPVPYSEATTPGMNPEYMTADQRFASRRPDVLTYQTEPLAEDLTLAGPIGALLQVATSGTDADWVVKLVDVYPDDTPDNPRAAPGVHLGGYQQLVRAEVMRGRFRESFSQPKPFVAQQVTAVPFTLQDVLHTFRKGHRLMVQVQSTWFPLVDRNPQTYVPNIYEAADMDFRAQTHQLYHTPAHASHLVVHVLPAATH